MEPERPPTTSARSSATFLDEATGPAIRAVARQSGFVILYGLGDDYDADDFHASY
jgi:hypothetical protein